MTNKGPYTLNEKDQLSPAFKAAEQNTHAEKMPAQNSPMVTKPPTPVPAPKGPARNDMARQIHNEALARERKLEADRQSLAIKVAEEMKNRQRSQDMVKSKDRNEREY